MPDETIFEKNAELNNFLNNSLSGSVFAMDEQEVLAVVRTLMAYERNYLSIERTQLAQLRTGLTLSLITPPAAATLAYAFDFLPRNYYLSIVVYIFLAIITLYGIWMSLQFVF